MTRNEQGRAERAARTMFASGSAPMMVALETMGPIRTYDVQVSPGGAFEIVRSDGTIVRSWMPVPGLPAGEAAMIARQQAKDLEMLCLRWTWEWEGDLAEFWRDNESISPEDRAECWRALLTRGEWYDGGGAAPLYRLRRIPNNGKDGAR